VFFDFNTMNAWGSLADTFIAPASAASGQITLAVYKGVAAGDLSCSFDDILLVVSGTSAQPDATSLCLGNGRFMARAQWTTRDGQTGPAQAVGLTSDTGYFWFFDPNNVEMLVKVLDGCGTNSRYWVFAGGLTNVLADLTITDTQTGAVRAYENPQGTAFLPIQDTSAFGACGTSPALTGQTVGRARIGVKSDAPARSSTDAPRKAAGQVVARPSPADARGACTPDAETLCVNDGRFAVSTQWTTADGQTGFGSPVSLTPDTGYFWFFNSANVEAVVKVLDGCGFNSSFWVFAGGLTNVNVRMTVTDMQSGAVRAYTNPQGTAFLPIQDTSAFEACQ
jgi:hypothetical protein